MNLAMIVPTEQQTPPAGPGGVERVCDILVRELIELGHTVDLYAGKGSTCPATNLITSSTNNLMGGEIELVNLFLDNVKTKKCNRYDCVIDSSTGHSIATTVDGTIPVLCIMTGDAYLKYPHSILPNRVYVSKEYAEEMGHINHPFLNNIISKNPEIEFPLGDGSGSYGLVLSNINTQKGVHLAAKASMMGSFPLKVAGPMSDMNYFKSSCNFASVEYVGPINNMKDKIKLLSEARALLFLSTCGEGDALTPKEAMACGTPVVASPQNGVKSLIEPGITGFFAFYPEDVAEMFWLAGSLDRKLIRKTVMGKINSKLQAEKLATLCERVKYDCKW